MRQTCSRRPGCARIAPIPESTPRAAFVRGCTRSRLIYAATGRVVVSDTEELPAADTIGKDHRFDHENEGYAAVHMRELISDLPTKQQQALHLRYFAALDYTAIANAMGCSEESARANVSQAMRKLKARW
ncbi:MAG: sigma-70 family RNA polymerase sigma factor [Candidatus Binatia bacterium]